MIAESEREEEGRLLAKMQAEFLINHFPGFDDAYLLETATEIESGYQGRLSANPH